ncbi:putative FMN-dependent luciferase-like monooxygenase [Aestuariimicrobium ganziense]|uniref:putative FMN-dependent luciferase-like monooxygenase n=1 Tax=Aestuariimicrobium ganziense TaxID=2773677 RepID=UPI00194526B6|nr:putative FMN-dependent luciferase-like monooxygenase [Aestuariimicrobium ganziense]
MTTLGYFTRLLDDTSPAERYRIATEQVRHAEDLGFQTAWVAQHHFHGAEGGLPSPLVFLAHTAALTSRIRLGTGVICIPMEDAVRTAEDVAVLDELSDGRVEVGISTGGTPASFPAFGVDFADRYTLSADKLATLRGAWAGNEINGTANRLYPAASGLNDRIWQATFSADGGARAGHDGDGLMLSRTQPRPEGAPDATLADLQVPIVERYLAELPQGATPRVMASRTIFVADTSQAARGWAEKGLRAAVARSPRAFGARAAVEGDLDALIRATDTFVGSPQEVAEALAADATLAHATELSAQVHSVDPPHREVLRSLELLASQVAPALGVEVATARSAA